MATTAKKSRIDECRAVGIQLRDEVVGNSTEALEWRQGREVSGPGAPDEVGIADRIDRDSCRPIIFRSSKVRAIDQARTVRGELDEKSVISDTGC